MVDVETESHDARRGMPGHHQRRRAGLGSSSTLMCAVCRGQVVDGKCRRCDRVGGETYDPAAANARLENAISALNREAEADSDEETSALAAKMTRHSAEEEGALIVQEKLAEKMKTLPVVDVNDVRNANSMMQSEQESAMYFASKKEMVVERKAKSVLQNTGPERRRAQLLSESTKRAHRTDFKGDAIDAGPWDLTDVKGRYHLAHINAGEIVAGEAVELVPIAGSNVEVDRWRQDNMLDTVRNVEHAAASIKAGRANIAKAAGRLKTTEVKTDYNMRFGLRHREVETVLEKKDMHMAAAKASINAMLAKEHELSEKAQVMDGGFAVAKALRRLHEDVEVGNIERLKTALQLQFDGEETFKAMTDWERFQFDTAVERMNVYPVQDIDGPDEDKDMNTPLFKAVQRGNVEVVKLLLKYGARPNLLNALGESPIHHTWRSWDTRHHLSAKEYRYFTAQTFAVLKLLVESGADINVQDATRKDSVLHLAARFGPTDIVQYLLALRAPLDAVNHRSERPIDVAKKLIGRRAHAQESANLLERWSAVETSMKHHEFTSEWQNFLRNPNKTLIGVTAEEVVEQLGHEERKRFAEKMARHGAVQWVDKILDDYNAPANVRLADLQHKQALERKKHELNRRRKAAPLTRGAKADKKLAVRLDDFLHRGDDGGFLTREQVHERLDLARRMRNKKFAAKQEYVTTKESKNARERAAKRAKAKAREDDRLAEMKIDMPVRWRRLQAAREVVKDVLAPDQSPHFGRPAIMSSIFHSGAQMQNNELNRDANFSQNRIHAKHEGCGALLSLLKQDDDTDACNNKAKVTLNESFALTQGRTHAQHFKKKGALWVVAPSRRRPDIEQAQRTPTDAWKHITHEYEISAHAEDTYSRLPLEGFEMLAQRNPFKQTAQTLNGTTLERELRVLTTKNVDLYTDPA